MSAIPITINGVIIDLYGRTIMGPVKIVGEIMRSDVSVGGGPIFPPEKPPVEPPNGGNGDKPHPSHPIALPGDPWWPKPPIDVPPLPPPGSPPVIIPGTTPVHPVTPPPAIVVDYPGVGKVLVPQPVV